MIISQPGYYIFQNDENQTDFMDQEISNNVNALESIVRKKCANTV